MNDTTTCSAASTRDDPAAVNKLFATLQAQAALAGIALSRFDDDRGRAVYVASKWALTRQLDTLDEVRSFLVKIGGAR